MRKPKRVIRTKRLYKKHVFPKRALGKLLFFLLLIIIIGIGFLIMREWNARFGNNIPPAPPSSDIISDISSSPASDTVSSDVSAPVIVSRIGSTAFVSAKNLIGRKAELSSLMTELKNAGYSSVAIEMKPETGLLPYLSGSEIAKQYKLIDENAIDAKAIADAAIAASIKPIAYLSTLKDKAAPHVSRENSYAYGTQLDINWNDNSVANGGKPWLNPYMAGTKEYIKELSLELHGAGFGTIMLDNVIFPDKNTEQMNTILTEPSRERALNLLVAEVEAALPEGTVIRISDVSTTMMKGDGSSDAAFSRIPSLIQGMRINLAGIEARKEAICTNAAIVPTEGYNPAIPAIDVASQLIEQAKTEWENPPCVIISKSDEAAMLPILKKCEITDFIVI